VVDSKEVGSVIGNLYNRRGTPKKNDQRGHQTIEEPIFFFLWGQRGRKGQKGIVEEEIQKTNSQEGEKR